VQWTADLGHAIQLPTLELSGKTGEFFRATKYAIARKRSVGTGRPAKGPNLLGQQSLVAVRFGHSPEPGRVQPVEVAYL
jgi:hypothetical protein